MGPSDVEQCYEACLVLQTLITEKIHTPCASQRRSSAWYRSHLCSSCLAPRLQALQANVLDHVLWRLHQLQVLHRSHPGLVQEHEPRGGDPSSWHCRTSFLGAPPLLLHSLATSRHPNAQNGNSAAHYTQLTRRNGPRHLCSCCYFDSCSLLPGPASHRYAEPTICSCKSTQARLLPQRGYGMPAPTTDAADGLQTSSLTEHCCSLQPQDLCQTRSLLRFWLATRPWPHS